MCDEDAIWVVEIQKVVKPIHIPDSRPADAAGIIEYVRVWRSVATVPLGR